VSGSLRGQGAAAGEIVWWVPEGGTTHFFAAWRYPKRRRLTLKTLVPGIYAKPFFDRLIRERLAEVEQEV
jgi:hypothetical protein